MSEVKRFSVDEFWRGIRVWVRSPHTADRRIATAELVAVDDVLDSWINGVSGAPLAPGQISQRVSWRRSTSSALRTIRVRPHIETPAVSFTLEGETVTHQISLNGERIVLDVQPDIDDVSSKWLKCNLLSRIEKWAFAEENKASHVSSGSLSLISPLKYNSLYQELKGKYGQKMVKIWPESTDPLKFVYEDIAIGSYLILLWDDERRKKNTTKKQSFVDLGCGNGLLVYILNSEGHPGWGVDIRKRKIWDFYPEFVTLKVEPVIPTNGVTYENVDWLIGNHSDELTPWVPVIAANNSFNCNFFVLPCCAYSLDGNKYQRQNSSKSQYYEYLEYVRTVCEMCGIHTRIDRLKIPSTKRLCFVGTDRAYSESDYETRLTVLKQFIHESIQNISKYKSNDNINTKISFVPRDPIEKVKNCTKIDKQVSSDIVMIVASNLLTEQNFIKDWNAGGNIALNEIIRYLSSDQLRILKNECGGLQTLLKNNHHIFEVHRGVVKLRYPVKRSDKLKQVVNSNFKRTVCWFYKNHPNGCPLSYNECKFLHE